MLNVLRKRAQSTAIQALVLLIAVVFIFWGVGSNLNNNRSAIATVNGQDISLQDFQNSYERAVDSYRQQFGGQIPQGFLEGLDLKQQVLDQLIRSEVLRQGGQEMGIMVSREATQREIEQMDVFQQNGNFALSRYKEVLGQNQLTPTSFEGGIQSDLLSRRVMNSIHSFALVPPGEVQSWADFTDAELKVAYVSFQSESFVDQVEVVEEDLNTWFAERREVYRADPKRRLNYLLFNSDEDLAQVVVDEAAIRQRYESELATYSTPEERHARHILFEVPEGSADDIRTAQREKAASVLEEVRAGADFAELAKTYSDGPTGVNGGDLGFFQRGTMVPAFDEVAFALQPGDVSDIVETSFGYHIIKLEAVRPASTKSYEEVKDTLSEAIKSGQVKGLTFKRASSAYEEIMRAGSLAKYAESGVEEVQSSEYFSRNNVPEGIVREAVFLDRAFALQKGELSSIIELKNGYAIIFVDDIAVPDLPELADVRDQVVKDYSQEKAVERARVNAEALLAESREQGNMAAAAAADLEVQESAYVKRTLQQIGGVPAQIIDDAFRLPGNERLPEKVVTSGTTFYVYEILDRRQGSQERAEQQLQQIEDQLRADLQNKLVASWLRRQYAASDIWINTAMMQ